MMKFYHEILLKKKKIFFFRSTVGEAELLSVLLVFLLNRAGEQVCHN